MKGGNDAELEKLQQMQDELHKLELEEENALSRLNSMLATSQTVDDKIQGLRKTLPTLNGLETTSQSIVNTIHDVLKSSEGISDKIRSLDRARNRVDECQKRVADLIDLEVCSQGVQQAIQDEDYEKGAAHIHRFLSIDQLSLQRTATDVENVSSVLKAVQTLQDAATKLRSIVQFKFDEAVAEDDLGHIERIFKVFPLLGMHDEGIRRFCMYLCGKLDSTAKKNLQTALATPITDKRHNIIFADVFTLLFEGFARIIDVHQPLFETYYGPGRLVTAISILQDECDKQVDRILVEFNRNRQLDRKVTDLNKSTDKLDPKDLDILIQEITIMHGRIELYLKFVQKKIANDLEAGLGEEAVRKQSEFQQRIAKSRLGRHKHELLSRYLRLEQYFMEESVNKAISIDSIDTSQHTSSMVDDTFFIIRKCIRRAISTDSLDGVCAVINNACTTLERSHCEIIRNRLRQGYPSGYLDLTQAYNVLQTSIQQGRLQPGDTEQGRIAFIVALNNANVSIEYVERLCDSTLQDVRQSLPSLSANEYGKLESCLSGLSSVTINLKEVINYGVQQLRASAIKPRVGPWVDAFLTINHQLNEDELSEYEAGQPFVHGLIANLDSLLSTFKDVLSTSNYDLLTEVLTEEVTTRFEKVIFKSTFNRLGGLVLDKEVRSLSGYLTSTASWTVRDRFARLTQISTVLNLEKLNEIYDYWGNHDGALTWRLTATELKAVLNMRSDFKADEIRRLKL